MKKINLYLLALLLFIVSMPSCKKDYGNLNSPTLEDYADATKDQLDNLVTGSLSGMRLNEGQYLDVVGVVGREMYRFSNAGSQVCNRITGCR
jgi:hypothetical protein